MKRAPRYINFIILGVTYLVFVVSQIHNVDSSTPVGNVLFGSIFNTGEAAAVIGLIGLIASLFIRDKSWRLQAAYLLFGGMGVVLITTVIAVIIISNSHNFAQ